MIQLQRFGPIALGVLLAGVAFAVYAAPRWGDTRYVTLMHLSDVHGHLVPHTDHFGETIQKRSGGLAKLATMIKHVRAQTPNRNLLLMVGDATQGSAETLYTRGNVIMPAFNALGIDAFTPGNWDFMYGPVVYRNRFAGENLPLTPNLTVSLGEEGVIRANFPTVAINVYSDRAKDAGQRVHPPYLIKEVNGVKVGIIGITSDNVPGQSDVFNLTFRFTNGFTELPGIIREVRSKGAELVVVMSELGLAKDVHLARETRGIDVMLSAHTHEITPTAIVVPETRTIVVESGEDQYLGRLDLAMRAGRVSGYSWNLIPINDAVPEDPDMKQIVDARRAPFVSGAAFRAHLFVPAGWPADKGYRLTEPLDTVVGQTDTLFERLNVFEEVANNFYADALRFVGKADIGITNGFRFDVPVAPGPITLADLYYYFPIAPAVAVAELTGSQIVRRINDSLDVVFSRNPYQITSGYVIGVSSNVRVTTDINNDPPTPTQGRARVEILNESTQTWAPIVLDKVYTIASCYAHGDPIDRVCRTDGGRNVKFATPSGNKPALITHQPPNPQPKKQVAPDDVYFPVPAIRAYLNSVGGTVAGAQYRTERYRTTTPVPASIFDPQGVITQPLQGAGPAWLERGVLINK